MTFRIIVSAALIAANIAFAGQAQAQFGGLQMPVLTWPGEHEGSKGDRAKACTAVCEKKIKP